MHENVRCPVAFRYEPEAAKPIEPFDLDSFETTCRSHRYMSSDRRHRRRTDRRRFIHGDNAESLQAFWPGQRRTNDASAFVCGLVAVAAQTGRVQQHIGHAVVRHHEAVALGPIEPLDDARYFDDTCWRLFSEDDIEAHAGLVRFLLELVQRHDAVSPLLC